VPAVQKEALDGRGQTCRLVSAAAGASGNRVLASYFQTPQICNANNNTAVLCRLCVSN